MTARAFKVYFKNSDSNGRLRVSQLALSGALRKGIARLGTLADDLSEPSTSMFKRILLIVFIGIILLITASYFLLQQSKQKTPPEYQTANLEKKTVYINDAELKVDIADDPHEQQRGLSGRNGLDDDEGMLFVFENLNTPEFWMKEMKFSLDILWIDSDNIIVGVTKNISPDTYPQRFLPPSPIKYVLEVNAGWTEKNNIKIGDALSF